MRPRAHTSLAGAQPPELCAHGLTSQHVVALGAAGRGVVTSATRSPLLHVKLLHVQGCGSKGWRRGRQAWAAREKEKKERDGQMQPGICMRMVS